MRIDFVVAIGVIVAALAFDVSRLELIGTAPRDRVRADRGDDQHRVEATVDVASTSFDPLAKLAKDIAAGAVLIAAIDAVAVGYLVFQAGRGSQL